MFFFVLFFNFATRSRWARTRLECTRTSCAPCSVTPSATIYSGRCSSRSKRPWHPSGCNRTRCSSYAASPSGGPCSAAARVTSTPTRWPSWICHGPWSVTSPTKTETPAPSRPTLAPVHTNHRVVVMGPMRVTPVGHTKAAGETCLTTVVVVCSTCPSTPTDVGAERLPTVSAIISFTYHSTAAPMAARYRKKHFGGKPKKKKEKNKF